MKIAIRYPCLLPSAANQRLHWAAKQRQCKSQRDMAMVETVRAIHGKTLVAPLTVYLTRGGSRLLDDDNLRSAFKSIRDGVADALGYSNDADKALTWVYVQAKTKRGAEFIDIAIEDIAEAKP